MANFELAVAKTILNEGGDKYIDRENDRGGPTKYGISSKLLSDILYQDNSNDPDYNHNDEFIERRIKNLDLNTAKTIYKKYFWDTNRYGEIEDQAIAEKVFDMAVLFGAPRSNKVIQMISKKLVKDGIIGNKTLDWINAISSFNEFTLKQLKYELFEFSVNICNKDSTQDDNLKGWLNRIMS